MAIIIKKKPITAAPEPVKSPEEYVEPRAAAPRKATGWRDLPVASTLDELWSNHGKMRPPEPIECTKCGSMYPFPCNGGNPRCMNSRFVDIKNS